MIPEDNELVDKDAFSNDCLYYRVGELINTDFIVSQKQIERRKMRLKSVAEREVKRAKLIDILNKKGKE